MSDRQRTDFDRMIRRAYTGREPDACPFCGEAYPHGLWDHMENCSKAKEKINK